MSRSLLFLAISFLVAAPLTQAQTATGTILGTVTDSSGAVIPNASVTIANKATGITRTLTTNAAGLFSAPALLAGDYEVRGEPGRLPAPQFVTPRFWLETTPL
jgi:hypothetical protein